SLPQCIMTLKKVSGTVSALAEAFCGMETVPDTFFKMEKHMRPNPVKRALQEGHPSVGTWLSMGSITAARFLARAGFAWLTIDIEHTLVDWETATHMFAAIADAGCIALARVPSKRQDHIKRVLDNGATGVVLTMVIS